jgi:hypothetical protein
MTSTYLPQHYPLFVALGDLELPSNIRERDPQDAKYAAFGAVKDQLRIHRVVAWLLEDTPEGNVTAIPVTMFGIGIRSTVAESPDDVRTLWKRELMDIATEALERLVNKEDNPS